MTVSPHSLAGVIIAGGYSTRFGDEDKAVADLAGTPMIRRVVDRLAAVTDEIIVNCRNDQREQIQTAIEGCAPDVQFAIDPIEDRGPLAGIRIALETTSREYAAVVACDMPFVDPALLSYLADQARGHDAAIVQVEDRWYQTTQAVYRSDTMARSAAAVLEDDDRRIVAALEEIDVVTVDESELEEIGVDNVTFESIDTQDALETAARRLS
ncbi:molybdenum cofactor guanylyltransferase [Natronobacterium gregoryi]|uniref:Probable molybdenum cofactor guanylyltransferase n=2 Tax=Natronobacterium gregoryi TaxID=44930 RepID=L0AF40_NATGS|nr:molybdenum cofactor guanylyltransferase [Natronobacterium gregoryi]AFZ71660.1 molybdopterin-guanine dinucleotide biosynthesis protein A [Natronobacterium gregoryi SP2]ELY66279.1 molybdopterin-guanine dinucleotide biosynthesis protein A [Natronobacterium gregoryi SP2]PLK18740.1 molybdenum cofactor guanylyltransferase [Natronobacterium gregoryi SP2]SFJ64994.1 molybdenum cofactor guanylyltransferase [Natronobacterium gregoryi]